MGVSIGRVAEVKAGEIRSAPGTGSPLRRSRRRLIRRQPVMMASLCVVATFTLIAIIGPFLNIPPPDYQDFTALQQAPSSSHWFGTDWLGRDVFSQMVYGARTSLIIGVGAVLLGSIAGWAWGLLSGYAGGRTDLASQRLLEVLMAFPTLVLVLALTAVFPPGVLTVIIAIAVSRIGSTARVIRGVALSTKPSEYVQAARALGARWHRVAVFHVAPSTLAPFIVLATAQVATGILVEATLGFLGVGVPPPTPSWGAMLSGALSLGTPPWWLTVIPGALISILVLAFTLAGDGLRDLLDPRLSTLG
jgi:ABC-type dipeptide/oligopeptide/nickel transport system permease subunit